jgi:hypothetical protein
MHPDNAKLLDVLTVDHGIEPIVIKQRRIGLWTASDGTQLYSLPVYTGNGLLTGVIYRDQELKFRRTSGKQPCLYGDGVLREITSCEVVLTLSDLDVLSAESLQIDPDVVAIPPGVTGLLRDDWVKALRRFDRVYLAFPPDKRSQDRLREIASQIGDMRARIVKLTHGLHGIHEAHTSGLSPETISKSIRDARPVDAVLDAIEAIEKSDPFVTSRLVENVVPSIAQADPAKREDYLTAIRARWGLRATQMKLLRREIDSLLEAEESDDDGKEEPLPEMTDEERTEALELLKDPDILEVIKRDLTEACGIVGEDHLKVGLALIMLSARLSKSPISATVFGASSEGKSYLIGQVAEVIPPEWVLKFSSFSSRALEYANEELMDRKILLVGELEGLGDDEALLSMIRQAQTENRLSRLVAQYDKDNGGPRVTMTEVTIRSSWIVATTQEGWHDENMTRCFCLFVSSDADQTKRILEYAKQSETIEFKKKEADRARRINRVRNALRLLQPLEVVMPWWVTHLSFPDKSARNRRDWSRYVQGIKLIAALRQHQKPTKTDPDTGMEHLEVDETDYRLGYDLFLPLLAGTLRELSERCMKVLRVAVKLTQDQLAEQDGEGDVDFSVKELQRKAEEVETDLSNGRDVRKQLRKLVQEDYLIVTNGAEQVGGGRAKRYKLASDGLSIGDDGSIVGLRHAALGVTSPDALAKVIETRGEA